MKPIKIIILAILLLTIIAISDAQMIKEINIGDTSYKVNSYLRKQDYIIYQQTDNVYLALDGYYMLVTLVYKDNYLVSYGMLMNDIQTLKAMTYFLTNYGEPATLGDNFYWFISQHIVAVLISDEDTDIVTILDYNYIHFIQEELEKARNK